MQKFILGAAAMALAACGETTSVTGGDKEPSGAAPSASGWAIDPAGGLNAFFDCLEDQGAAIVSAHRGGPYAGYPENAIETMQAMLANAPAIMEIDVATSADGILYLMHDDTLERTTNGEGEADGLPWDTIKSLRLENNEGKITTYAPPTFVETLKWADGKTLLQVDFKRSTRYEDVAEEIKRQDAEDRVILISHSMASAAKLHRLMPNTMISLSVNSQSELNRAVAAGVPADRLLGFTGIEGPRPRLFSTLNSRDVEVIFGTLGGYGSIDNEIERTGNDALYGELAAQGVDIIATDRPREAFAALAAAGMAPTAGACGITRH